MNSQHFSHVNVWGPYKCIGSKFDMPQKGQMLTLDHHFINFSRSPVPEDLCKVKGPRLIWFWKKIFLKVFTIYGHGSHLGQWTATISAIFRSPKLRRLHMKFEQH